MPAVRRPAAYLAAALLLSTAALAAAPAGAADDVDLIVFARAGDLWTVPADASGDADEVATNITNTGTVFEDSPSWASENVIRYVRAEGRASDGEVWQIEATGANAHRISPEGLRVDDVAWSSDGRVTYTRDLPTNPRKNQFQQDVFVADTNFLNPVNVSNHPDHDANPAITSDGSKIAFDSTREGSSSSVWVADLTASSLTVKRVETSDPADGGKFPAWSPDGTQLVYMEYVSPFTNWGLRIVNADGEERRLTTGAGNEWDPEFSPDGTQVVFSHWEGTPKQKFHIRRVVVADSVNQPAQSTPITTGDEIVSRYPSWQPTDVSTGADTGGDDPKEPCPLPLPLCGTSR